MAKIHSIRFVSVLMIFLILVTDIAIVYAEVNSNPVSPPRSDQHPASSIQHPASRNQHPRQVGISASLRPASSIQNPASSIQTLPQSSGKSPFRAGDAIHIDTFPDTTFVMNKYFPIDDRGMVEFPMIGKMKVTDLSQRELEDFLKSQYKNFLRYPTVRVKPAIRVSVLGGVNNPGMYYFDQNSSLWEVLQRAGGTTFEDGLKDLTWERDRDELNDDLISYLERGTSLRAMGFRSGDQLYTPSQYETFWTFFGANILPLLSFAATMYLLYYTYQRDLIYFETIRR